MTESNAGAKSSEAALLELLDVDLAERVRRLELFSRLRVEGLHSGDSPSPLKGFSSDFLQHRAYFHGDDLRRLDWRAFARTDRLVMKEYEELTDTRMAVVLDVSGSMGYAGAGFSKLEFAMRCSALLFYLMHLQQDPFGLFLFAENVRDKVSFGASRQHLLRVFERLVCLKAEGETRFEPCIYQLENTLRRRGIVVVFSDFMDDAERLCKAMGRLRMRGHDVIAFQVVDPSERELDYVDFTRFRDMETGEIVALDPTIVRAEYRRQFDAHQRRLNEHCLAHGLDFRVLSVRDEFEVAIGDYLRHRMSLNL
jgi:uncharacterized protein (DUF58 family)